MKKLNFKDKGTFKKLQESLMDVMNNRYNELCLNELKENLTSAPLYTTKHIFESISKDFYNTPKGKKILKEYIDTIKKNNSLRKAFIIFENMNKPQSVLSPDLFVNENLSFMQEIKPSEYKAGLKKINNIIRESIELAALNTEELEELIKESETDEAEAIDYLINNRKTLKNIAEYTNKVSTLTESVKNKRIFKSEDALSESLNISDLLNMINESVSGLGKEEANAVKDLTLISLSGQDGKEIYETYKNKCKDILEEAVKNEEALETRSRFQRMLGQINERNYNKSTLNEDVLNFARLYATLKENE